MPDPPGHPGRYHQHLRQAEELRTFAGGKPSDPSSWEDWHKQVDALVTARLPHPDTEEIGMTGITSGPHLHFEVQVSGDARNPRLYLPR